MLNPIRKIKNKEKNKRCFVLANGPSINDLDLSQLKDEVVIGMNASPLLEKNHDFKHSYYVLSDRRFITDSKYKKDIALNMVDGNVVKVFRREIEDVYPANANNTYYVQALERDGFSLNLRQGYYYGRTTVMLALQLAYYLGCSEIYLLGFDLTYNPLRPRFYEENEIQIDDAQASIQIFNVHRAYLDLKNVGVKLFQCNEISLARNYIPFKKFCSLF